MPRGELPAQARRHVAVDRVGVIGVQREGRLLRELTQEGLEKVGDRVLAQVARYEADVQPAGRVAVLFDPTVRSGVLLTTLVGVIKPL